MREYIVYVERLINRSLMSNDPREKTELREELELSGLSPTILAVL